MKNIWRRGLVGTVALLLTAALGCSFSHSSKSFSKSSRSSSNSSSSSSPGAAKRAYEEDVRDYTSAYIMSGGQISAFQKKLSDLAEENGISNWEQDLITYEAVGEGLADAGASQIQVDTFKENLCGGDAKKEGAMQAGYDSAR